MGRNTLGQRRDALPNLERTLLWSMRAWVVGLCRPEAGVGRRIESAFAELGAQSAAGYLGGFMWAVRHGAMRTIGVDCPCNPHLEADERALLDVFAFAQHDHASEATMLLRTMVTPGATWAALNSACRLGDALRRAGLILACPAEDDRAEWRSLLQHMPVSTTVH